MATTFEIITWQRAIQLMEREQGQIIYQGETRAPWRRASFITLPLKKILESEWFLERELVMYTVVGTTVGTQDSVKTVAMYMLATTPWGNLLEHPENAPTHYAISIAEIEAPCSNTKAPSQPST